MRKFLFLVFMLAVFFLVTYIAAKLYSFVPSKIYTLKIDGAINPVIADYVARGIAEAERSNAAAVLLIMDTPGGLLESTRSIIQTMLNTKIPVVVYVSPQGARAASAGVFIMMASDVAAMAPLTHIGAAHPVNIGGGMPFDGKRKEDTEKKQNGSGGAQPDSKIMDQKVLSDTVAYIENLAKGKGRNYEWAVKAVRESVSVTAKEALDLKVIDYIADSAEELLNSIDGKEISKNNLKIKLNLSNALRVDFSLSAFKKFLNALANPNIAYILLMLGFYGIIYEFSTPGIGLGAVAGSISLILAFYALQMMPVNFVGLALLILGLVMLLLEIKIVSGGLLTVGGITAFILGSFFLIDASANYLKISVWVIAGVALGTLLFFGYAMKKVVEIHRKKPATGKEGLIGEIGLVKEEINPEGMVFVHGELWSAVSGEFCEVGSRVEVEAVKDNKLSVKKIH